MKKTLILILFASAYLSITSYVFPATMYVIQYPKNGTNDAALQSALDAAVATANSQLALFKNQTDLAKGFADTNAFTSHSSSLQGYQNYDLFAVGVGFMIGLQAPSIDPNYYEKKIEDDIKNDGDISAGFSVSASIIAGIHARFILPHLYLSLQLGQFNVDDAENDYKFSNKTFGIGVNYGIYMPRSFFVGLLKWRGISIGSGIIYQHNEVNFELQLDTITQPVAGSIQLELDPSVNFGFDITTYTIPLEIVTSFQLLWFLNISAGIGADIIFGSSDILLTSTGEVSVTGTTLTQNGIVQVDGSTRDVSPSLIRPKIMGGIGFNIFLVKIEIPIIYYPTTGAALGLTASIVF
ncbi:MAG: hypothetical protein N2316_06445 [Spirochaetes bacterium]|nr:hypothetical protein [Spirochaetota bacterium]